MTTPAGELNDSTAYGWFLHRHALEPDVAREHVDAVHQHLAVAGRPPRDVARGVPAFVNRIRPPYAPACSRNVSPGCATLSAAAMPPNGDSGDPVPPPAPGTTWKMRPVTGARGTGRVRTVTIARLAAAVGIGQRQPSRRSSCPGRETGRCRRACCCRCNRCARAAARVATLSCRSCGTPRPQSRHGSYRS